MFPEFLGVDLTFEVNKEKRELLITAGIDGYKKVFTAFRRFMSSKQVYDVGFVDNASFSN